MNNHHYVISNCQNLSHRTSSLESTHPKSPLELNLHVSTLELSITASPLEQGQPTLRLLTCSLQPSSPKCSLELELLYTRHHSVHRKLLARVLYKTNFKCARKFQRGYIFVTCVTTLDIFLFYHLAVSIHCVKIC